MATADIDIKVTRIQALWRGYIYHKALPFALSSRSSNLAAEADNAYNISNNMLSVAMVEKIEHKKSNICGDWCGGVRELQIRELCHELRTMAVEKINQMNYTCRFSEIQENCLPLYGICLSKVDIRILSDGVEIARKNLNYTTLDWVAMSSNTLYERRNQKLQQLLYAFTIPYCVELGFRTITVDTVTGATQHLAKKYGFTLGAVDPDQRVVIDDEWEQYPERYEDELGHEIKSIFGEYRDLSSEILKDMSNESIVYTANKVLSIFPHSEKTKTWMDKNKNKVVPNLDNCELSIKDAYDNYTPDILVTLKKLRTFIRKY